MLPLSRYPDGEVPWEGGHVESPTKGQQDMPLNQHACSRRMLVETPETMLLCLIMLNPAWEFELPHAVTTKRIFQLCNV